MRGGFALLGVGALLVGVGGGCMALLGPVPCETDDQCPDQLVCVDELCVDGQARDDAGPPPADGGRDDEDGGGGEPDAGDEDDGGAPPADAGEDGGPPDDDAGPADGGPPTDGGNQAPVAVDDTGTTDEDPGAPLTIDVLANDSDPEGGALTLVNVATPDNGEVTFTGEGVISYTPDLDFFGTETFTYDVVDPLGATATATVTVTVTPVDDPPVAPDATWYVSIDGTVTDTLPGFDKDGDTLTFELVTPPAPLLGDVVLVDASTGVATYTPDGDQSGADPIGYRVFDGTSYSALGTITVVVIAKTWIGAVNNSWQQGGNWSPTGAPTASDSVWIRAAVPSDPVLGANVTIDSLLVEEGSFLELSDFDLTVTRGYRTPPPDAAGSITAQTGWMVFAGTVSGARGTVPRLRVVGDASLDGELVVQDQLDVPQDGVLRVGAHSLEVLGATTVAYDSASEGLWMTDDAGRASFVGPLTLDGLNDAASQQNTLTAGEVWLFDDLTTIDTSSNPKTLSPGGTRFVFAGTDQTVTVETPSPTLSRFFDVHVDATAQVTFATPAVVGGRFTMDDTATVNGSQLDFTAALPDTAPGYSVTTTNVVGNVVQTQDVRVHGDTFVLAGATLDVGSTTTRFFGDLRVDVSSSATGLLIKDPAASLTVDGNFTLEGTTSSSGSTTRLTDGVLRVRGDFTQLHYSTESDVFVAEGGTRVVFDGSDAQVVSFQGGTQSGSRFGDVRVENTVGVRVDTPAWAAGAVVVAAGAVLVIAQPLHVEGAFLMEGAATVNGAGELHMKGDVPNTADGYDVVTLVDGPAQLPGDRVFHGALLEVTSVGSIDVNGHRLELLGSYWQETDSTNQDGLLMNDAADEVIVHGDVEMTCDWSTGTTSNRFTDGTLRVGGDFSQTRTSTEDESFLATGTLVVLDGAATQTVTFQDPLQNGSRFATLRVENPVGVVFASDVWVRDELVLADGAAVQIDSVLHADGLVTFEGAAATTGAGQLWLYDSVPETPDGTAVDVRVAGNITLAGDRVVRAASFGPRDGAQLHLGGFTLEVVGDLDVEIDSNSDGLFLNGATDTVIVRGDARFRGVSTSSDANGNLSDGVLRLFGSFEETATYSLSRVFYSTGTAVVFESGQTSTVSLANGASYARFDDVTVTSGTTVQTQSSIQIAGGLLVGGTWEVSGGQTTSVAGDLSVSAGGELVNNGSISYGGTYVNDGTLTGNAPQQN